MKTRKGFISNSSSSSFIVGVGKIKNLDQFKSWAKKNKIETSVASYGDVGIYTTADLLEGNGWSFGINQGVDKGSQESELWVEEPTNCGGKVSAKFDPAGDDLYCIILIGNNEGDEPFWDGDDYQYDISSDYFEGSQQAILQMLGEEKLLEKSSYSFGAGRNG